GEQLLDDPSGRRPCRLINALRGRGCKGDQQPSEVGAGNPAATLYLLEEPQARLPARQGRHDRVLPAGQRQGTSTARNRREYVEIANLHPFEREREGRHVQERSKGEIQAWGVLADCG